MPDEPTLGELGRRIDAQAQANRASFEALNKRLDLMPTNELMLAHLATYEARIKNVEADIVEMKTKTQQAKSLAITGLGVAVSVVLAILAIVQQGGVAG